MADTTPEVKLEKQLRKVVRSYGGDCVKFEAEKGLPDRVIWLPESCMFFV